MVGGAWQVPPSSCKAVPEPAVSLQLWFPPVLRRQQRLHWRNLGESRKHWHLTNLGFSHEDAGVHMPGGVFSEQLSTNLRQAPSWCWQCGSEFPGCAGAMTGGGLSGVDYMVGNRVAENHVSQLTVKACSE